MTSARGARPHGDGARFEVWAPRAQRVDVVLGDRRVALDRGDDAWFAADVAGVGAGTDYAFSLDGGEPLPDPRSASQPHGVHGPSRVVDHSSFAWSDDGWCAAPLPSHVVYELHVGTFTEAGTFDAAVERLPHLVDLGVTAVELMPVCEFPGARGWGYDGVDLYAPHRAYGGPDRLKRLVDACHAHGLAAILDVVYNHLGPDGNHLGAFGPYFSSRYATPWGDAVNLDDTHSDEVRAFFVDNALTWLVEYHFDGLRLDAAHAIFDSSAVHFLEELTARVRALESQLGRTLFVVAESDLNDPRLVRPVGDGGYGLDAQWSDDFHHALHAALTGERDGYYADFGALGDVAKALHDAYVYDGRYSPFRRRRHGRPATGVPGHRFLGYAQNHDQVGNRARGERSAALAAPRLLKVAAALVLTAPFVPMLFHGEEWGATTPFLYFTDHRDPALGRAVSEGRRREFAMFGWRPEDVPDPQDPRTFARSKLDWSQLHDGAHAELLEWHRRLIALRRATPELCDGDRDALTARHDDDALWIVVERGAITVVCNLSDVAVEVDLAAGRAGDVLLASAEAVVTARGVRVAPHGVAIYRAH